MLGKGIHISQTQTPPTPLSGQDHTIFPNVIKQQHNPLAYLRHLLPPTPTVSPPPTTGKSRFPLEVTRAPLALHSYSSDNTRMGEDNFSLHNTMTDDYFFPNSQPVIPFQIIANFKLSK
jgi:hypothetical protein